VANVDTQQSVQLANIEGWQALLRGGNGPCTLIITGGVAIHAVSIYVVATIMPVVVGDIGGLAFFAWTTMLYVAGSLFGASAVPVLLSRFSPRAAYRIAFALFLSGSMVCSIAPTLGVLLVGRLSQGGGGMLPALAYAIIRQTFQASLHARAISLVGSVWGMAALTGPTSPRPSKVRTAISEGRPPTRLVSTVASEKIEPNIPSVRRGPSVSASQPPNNWITA
jgi:MFS family permease